MEDKSDLTEEQKKAKEGALAQAVAYEGMVRTEGWAYAKGYYEMTLKKFIGDLFNQENDPIENYEAQRQQLIGLKKFFGDIDWSIKTLTDERAKEQSNKAK